MRRLLITMLALCACGLPAASNDQDAGPLDSGHDDRDDAGALDGGSVDASVPDAGLPDAGLPDAGFTSAHVGWARYTIAPGAHAATVALNGAATSPLAGLSFATGRTYEFIFTPTAEYVLTNPVQPDDQLDWNKLPGLSDCGTIDLAADGAMFGWRWRLDTVPEVLEITAYANDAGKHLTPPQPLFTLDAADLASVTPLRYRLTADGALYRYAVSGTMRGRMIDATATLARRCATTPPSSLPVQWAAGFYFGGTSTAPTTITSRIFERPLL